MEERSQTEPKSNGVLENGGLDVVEVKAAYEEGEREDNGKESKLERVCSVEMIAAVS